MLNFPLQAASAFTAGLGTSLSPCVYPMIPITVGFLGSSSSAPESRSRTRIIAFATGQILTFTALGVLAVSLGEILGFSSDMPSIQIATGILLLTFAAVSLFDRLPDFLYRFNRFTPAKVNGVGGALVLGASSAAIASPCTSPVIGGVLAAISQSEERLKGISLMFSFAVGLSFLFIVVGLGLSRLPRAGQWMHYVQKTSGVLLILAGVNYLLKGFGVFS